MNRLVLDRLQKQKLSCFHRLAVLLLPLYLLPSVTWGQLGAVNSDPIQRIREARGNAAYGLFANYLPTGNEFAGENSSGDPGQFTSTSHRLSLEAFSIINFYRDRLILNLSLMPIWQWQSQEFVAQNGARDSDHSSSEDWSHQVGLDWRFIDTEKSEVRFGTALQVDHWWGLHVGGFYMTDPLILEVQMAHYQHDSGLSELGLSNGVGFVVNDLVSLAFLSGMQIPLNETAPPEWQAIFQVRFRTDAFSRFEAIFQGLSRIASGRIHPGVGGGFIHWGHFGTPSDSH